MIHKQRTVALIVAAGSGSRAGGAIPKQYAHVGGKALLAHAYAAFAGHTAVDEVGVVIAAGAEPLAAAALGPVRTIVGGATRRESVARGLAAIEADRVLVHDAARPFVPAQVIDRAQIESSQATSLQELLRGRAGINLTNAGGLGKQSSLFLRGTNSGHTVVLVDGVRINSADLGLAMYQDLPLAQIERAMTLFEQDPRTCCKVILQMD